jgi:hypothetical protein
MRARKRPIPTAKLCLRLGDTAVASQDRMPSTVMRRKTSPLTKTAPSICGQAIPIAVRLKATKAFSPM